MIRACIALAALGLGVTAAVADGAFDSVAACLQNGYDIKASFSDNNGGAYVLLQKGTSAYICHSNPAPRCEKLN